MHELSAFGIPINLEACFGSLRWNMNPHQCMFDRVSLRLGCDLDLRPENALVPCLTEVVVPLAVPRADIAAL